MHSKNLYFRFRNPDGVVGAGLLALVLAFCLALLERNQLQNGFTFLPGDRYDAVISTSILEHWYNVFRGQAVWSEVKYFFPYSRTIAQTDAYFLVGLAYAPFRLFGLDPFISHELAGLVVKSIGFFGAYLLSRKSFNFSFWFALLVAVLFTISNGMTSHSSRLQLSTVALTPFVGFFLLNTINAFWLENSRGLLIWGIATAAAFGAWCLTCFYMAWFFAFYILLLFVVFMFMMKAEQFLDVFEKVKRQYIFILIIAACALLSLLPFVWAFLPKSQEVGVRTYEMVFANTVPIEAVMQVGRSNILYGTLYNEVLAFISPNYAPNGEYYNNGFSPALFYFFLVGSFVAYTNRVKSDRARLVSILAITSLVSLLLLVKVSGVSAWFVVYSIVPGAKALNAVSTFLLFLAFPVIVVSVYCLQRERISSFLLSFMVVILVVGEINTPNLNLNRDLENRRLTLHELPPDECRAFYVSGWAEQEKIPGYLEWINAYYAHNVTAMMIAQMINLPTVNGVASFNQPDWNFGFPNNSDYDARVLAYAGKHGIDRLCRLDLNTKRWAVKVP